MARAALPRADAPLAPFVPALVSPAPAPCSPSSLVPPSIESNSRTACLALVFRVHRFDVLAIRTPSECLSLHPAASGFMGPFTLVETQPRSPLTQFHIRPNNILCEAIFSEPNATGVHSGIVRGAAEYAQQLQMGHMVYTVFGTVSYQRSDMHVDCSGVRQLDHVRSLAAVIHAGVLTCVRLTRYCVDSAIGRYVSVSESSLLEHLVRGLLIKHGVVIQTQLDDTANALHLRIQHLGSVLRAARGLASIPPEGRARDVIPVIAVTIAPAICALIERATVTLLVTRTGAVTYRFCFNDPVCLSPTDLRLVDAHMARLVEELNHLFYMLT